MAKNLKKDTSQSEKAPSATPAIEQSPDPLPKVKQPSGELREDVNKEEPMKVDSPKNTDK